MRYYAVCLILKNYLNILLSMRYMANIIVPSEDINFILNKIY